MEGDFKMEVFTFLFDDLTVVDGVCLLPRKY